MNEKNKYEELEYRIEALERKVEELMDLIVTNNYRGHLYPDERKWRT